MLLYMIRHADPDYEQGTITPEGHLEAAALADMLEEQGLDHIYTSPLGRAVHTMEYTTQRLHKEYEFLDWTEEITGMYQDIEGIGTVAPFNVPGEFIVNQEPFPTHDNWFENKYFHQNEPLMEKIAQIKQGSDQLLEKHGYKREGGRYRCLRPNKDKIAVFCHGGLGVTWLAHLLQIPISIAWSSFWLAPSSVTTVLMDQRTEQWAVPRCIELGATSHLHKAALPVKFRGLPTI
ncbi:histidine phosphatase family protein [Paenibacillus chungangensis]|uniref:Histidine phosphatase family protein n=1 Tax=Paenibacillus chungangensis TaxID=696535 RepID=A0ABW3HRU6_9BACL